MWLLIAVSLVWAFSFGLIKGRLTGLDPVAVSVVRLALAMLIFAPFLRLKGLGAGFVVRLASVGAVQFGLMYVLYLRAFTYLQAYEVVLFTVFTPLYVALIDALMERRFVARYLAAAALAVIGAIVVLWSRGLARESVTGFLLMQGSNLCFAAGQIAYRRLRPRAAETSNTVLFSWLYVGALVATLLLSAGATDWSAFRPTLPQWGTLLYLGVLASGICFFAWNTGALHVNAGTLAVFNNLKIPLGIAASLLVFGETANVARLSVSLVLMAVAVWLSERSPAVTGLRAKSG